MRDNLRIVVLPISSISSLERPMMIAGGACAKRIQVNSTDALGSVRAVTKRVNGTLQITRHDFMPFGEEVAPPTPPQDKRLFTGKERDSETGLDYFEARYMRASVGRFASPDLPGVDQHPNDPQSWNLYVYVGNNPLRYIDPSGRYRWAPSGCQGNEACEQDYAKNQQRFRDALIELEKKKDSLPGDSYERAILQATLDAYGQENTTQLNVTVGFASLPGDVDARTTPDGHGNFAVRFDPSHFSGKKMWAVDAAHEGTHISTHSLLPARLLQLSPFHDEYRAYFTSAVVARLVKLSSLSYNTGYEIWNSSWKDSERADRIAAGIALHVKFAYKKDIPYSWAAVSGRLRLR